LGESKDLSQRADNYDFAVAAFLSGVDFNLIDKRTDYVHSLGTCGLVIKNLQQFGDLPAVQVRLHAHLHNRAWLHGKDQARVRQAKRQDHRLSVDPVEDHKNWANDIEETQGVAPTTR
jgi:hypothetical protein